MTRNSLKDLVLAGLSGLMLTASLSPVDLDRIAWISLIPLLKSLENKSRSAAFKTGLFTGLLHYLTLIYWIVVVLSRYGDITLILALAALILLCSYCAVYIALFAFFVVSFKKNRLSAFWGAGIWVSLEYIRAHIMTGFPWCLLGYSQYSRLPLIQVSDIAGVYCISFVIVLVNFVIYTILFGSNTKKRKVAYAISTSLLIGFILLYGLQAMKKKGENNRDGKKLRAVIVQGNIDQSVKWNPDFQENTMAIYKRLSAKSVDFKPQIIIWPETAVPFFFQDGSHLSQEVFRVSRLTNSKILFGSPAYVKEKKAIRYFNRAYIISDVRILDYYDKVHLVPFGEYVPLKKYIPFFHRIVPAAGDFSAGEKVKPLNTPDIKMGVLICFETIFPDISRKLAKGGAKLLVNLTNDAWFGKTSAPYQHLSMAVFRCVENGLPMARAANTGISAFILGSGKIVDKSGLYVREILKHHVVLHHHKTIYSQFGDIFAILLMIMTSIRVFWAETRKRR